MPHKERNPSAHYIEIDNQYWLMDCGEGTQFRMLKYGFKRSKLDGILISHLHADHYLGLFGLLSSMSMDQRVKPLIIIAPSDLKKLIEFQFNKSSFQLSYRIDFLPLEESNKEVPLVDNGRFKIHTHPVQHRIPCWAFKFQYHRRIYHLRKDKISGLPVEALKVLSKGEDFSDTVMAADHTEVQIIDKKYVYCTDTLYLPEMISFAQGADALYHETTFLNEKKKRAIETFHSTTGDAAKIATEAEVNQLIIGHFSSRYDDVTVFLEETKEGFTNSFIAEEGMSLVF